MCKIFSDYANSKYFVQNFNALPLGIVRVVPKKKGGNSKKKLKKAKTYGKTGSSSYASGMQEWLKKVRVGPFTYPVDHLYPPDLAWRARERREEGVKRVYDSLTRFGNMQQMIWGG